jgi:uncharacterized membrane protein YphA (DoxX/SURF4 family)
MRIRLFLGMLMLVSLSIAQQPFVPKHSFNLEVSLPNSMKNEAFQDHLQGLVNVAPFYQYALKNGIAFGVGVRYGYYTVNEFRVPQPVTGGMHMASAFIKAGWEKFHTERFATDLSVKIGYTQNYFLTDRNDTLGVNPQQVNAWYIEPTVGFILTADEVTSYRLFFGYGLQSFRYESSMLGLSTTGGYTDKELAKNTSYLLVGFGFTYYFRPKSERGSGGEL